MTTHSYLKGICPICGQPGVVPAATRFGFRAVMFRCAHCAADLETYATKRSLLAIAVVMGGLVTLFGFALLAVHRDWNSLVAVSSLGAIGAVTWAFAYRTVLHNTALRSRR